MPETLTDLINRQAAAAKAEEEREPTAAEQISQLWKSLDDDTMAVIYKEAPGVLVAWDRGDFNVVIKLILTNTSEELKPLRDQIIPLLPVPEPEA